MSKAQFLKADKAFVNNEMVFQPTTKDGLENFSIWDNADKKFLREDTPITIESGPTTVTKYIKLSDNDKKRFTRNVKVIREIIFNGQKYVYGFPMSVDKQLVTIMRSIEAVGANPLDSVFKIVKEQDPNNKILTSYEVSVVGKNSPKLPEPEIDLDDDKVTATETELQYLNAIKKKYPDYSSRAPSVWSELLSKKINITLERANVLVNEYLYS